MGHADPGRDAADPEEIVAGPGRRPPAAGAHLRHAGARRLPRAPTTRSSPRPPRRAAGSSDVPRGSRRTPARAEAERCLDAGAVGIKLHPRSDAFDLPHPTVDRLVALAAAPRGARPVPRGRGIPELGAAAVRWPASTRGRDHPRPRRDLRPGQPARAGRRAAQPLLRHGLVAGGRRPAALLGRAARPDPVRERHALRARDVRLLPVPARRAPGRALRRADRRDGRRAAAAASSRGRTRSTSGPPTGDARSAALGGARARDRGTRHRRSSSRSAAGTRPSRSRSRARAASARPATRTPSCLAAGRRAARAGRRRAQRRPTRWPSCRPP
jgi:hypothetical protein